MRHAFTRPRCVLFGLLAILAGLGTGCATSQYGEQITAVNHYPRCYAPIQDLRDADTNFNRTVAASTGIGVLGGALVGFLASGRIQGALVGAAAGGAAGAGIGYSKARQERIADDNQRMASYLVDLEGDISGIDRATAAARTARDCYDKEFRLAIADYKAGRMSRADLSARYTEIKNGCTEAEAILGNVIAATGDKERDYQAALQSEAERAGKPVPVVTASAPAQPSGQDPAPRASRPKSVSGKTAAAQPVQSAQPAQAAAPKAATVKKTSAPRRGDNSLEAVAQNTQRLGESRQSAAEEKEALRKMQEEMDGTLGTLLS